MHFRQIHLEDGGRTRNRKVCEIEGQELSEDHLIPVAEQDLAQMPLPTARAIDIVAFADAESITPVQYGAGDSYLRAKGEVALKPYILLRKALARTDKVAVAKYALRGRERLGVLRPHGDALLVMLTSGWFSGT